MGWHRAIVGLLVGLLLHGSILAVVPLVWCIGVHGHNAIEVCAAPNCHQVSDDTRRSALDGHSPTVDDPHQQPCSDRCVMGEELGAPQPLTQVVTPVLVDVPAPLVIFTALACIDRCRAYIDRTPSCAPPEPQTPRSLVLRI